MTDERRLSVPDAEPVRLSLAPFEERRVTSVLSDLFIDVRKKGWSGVDDIPPGSGGKHRIVISEAS